MSPTTWWGFILVLIITGAGYQTGLESRDGVVGGPTYSNEAALLSQAALYDPARAENALEDKPVAYLLINETEALADTNPLKPALTQKDNLMIYKVQAGDTLSTIAHNFGVPQEALLPLSESSKKILKIGEELMILPVAGTVHLVKNGETLSEISKKYDVGVERIKQFNNIFAPGVSLVIPDVPTQAPNYQKTTGVTKPDLAGYFKKPAEGFNWGEEHNYNAVDIANACGTAIYAAAEGVVTKVEIGGWGGGYGNYVVIEHLNGTETLYAHNRKILVEVGDMMARGEIIAEMGNTGNVSGSTGCHLHFEVHGAENPFIK